MFTVLASSFTIKPTHDEPISDLRHRVKGAIQKQLEELIRQQDQDIPLNWELHTTWQASDSTTTLQWNEWEHSERPALMLAECRLTYQIRQCPWEVELRFGTTEDCGHISIVWRTSGTSETNGLLRTPPPLLRRLASALARERCCTEVSATSFSVTDLTTEGILAFCDSILRNPVRQMPVVLIAPQDSDGRFLLDAEKLAKQMFGLALVYRLADAGAAQKLVGAVGASWACYDGAVRLYWPWRQDDRAMRHPYRSAARQRAAKPQEIQDWLFGAVRDGSRRDFVEPDGLRYLARLQREDDAARWRRGAVENGEWINELQRTVEENDRLRERARQLEAEIQRLQQAYQTNLDEVRGKNSYLASRVAQLEQREFTSTDTPVTSCRLSLSAQAVRTFQQAAANQQRDYRREIEKLNTQLRKSQVKTMTHDKGDYQVFPRGAKSIRIFFYEHNDGSVRICELSHHNDRTYDDLYGRGVYRLDYDAEDFLPWTAVLSEADEMVAD